MCFNSDEKFVSGHHCKNKQAFLIEPMDSEDEVTNTENDQEKSEEVEISVHAMAGVRGPRTMRFKTLVKKQRMVVLIDNGSSHNFINQRLATKLNFIAQQVEPFSVKVANGEDIPC